MSDTPPPFEAVKYDDGTISYPGHAVGQLGGEPVETIDLCDRTATIITWTSVTATPPGVPAPNTLAIVEFNIDGTPVRAIGQLTTDDAETGMEVRPVYEPSLRDPAGTIRHQASQAWDGYRFEPIQR